MIVLWVSGKEQPIRYHGDNALSGPNTGICCLDNRSYIIASANPTILTYVVDDVAQSSITVKSITGDESFTCVGIQLADDWSEVYLLMHNNQGRVCIERIAFNIGTGEFTWHPTMPINIPSAYRPLRDHLTIDWTREASTIANMTVPDRLKEKGLVIDKYEDIPIGPASFDYPPVFARVGTKLVVGINHVQPIGIFHTHQWDYTTREEFESVWLSKIRASDELIRGHWLANVKRFFTHIEIAEGENYWKTQLDSPATYLEGEWWRYNRQWQLQESWGFCSDLYPGAPSVCTICGELSPCTCTSSKEMPTGEFEYYDIDRIWCRTLLQHPTLISSLLVIDTLTNTVDGVTHIASSHIGKSAKNDPNYLINGMIAVGNEIDVTFSKMKKDIPLSPLRWGTVPLGRDVISNSVSAEWPLFRLLQWYGSSHLPWICDNEYPMLKGEDYHNRRLLKTYDLGDLMNGSSFLTPAIQKIEPASMKMPYHPLTMPEFCVSASLSDTHGVGRTVSVDKNYKYEITSHEFVSKYKDAEIGRGQDISAGMVIANVEKTVQVTMTNHDRRQLTLYDIKVSVIPSENYPYYSFVKLEGADNVIHDSLDYGTSWTFNVTILCPTSQEHPKPVLLKTEYSKVVPVPCIPDK